MRPLPTDPLSSDVYDQLWMRWRWYHLIRIRTSVKLLFTVFRPFTAMDASNWQSEIFFLAPFCQSVHSRVRMRIFSFWDFPASSSIYAFTTLTVKSGFVLSSICRSAISRSGWGIFLRFSYFSGFRSGTFWVFPTSSSIYQLGSLRRSREPSFLGNSNGMFLPLFSSGSLDVHLFFLGG